MSNSDVFSDLIHRIRCGDQQAAEELVREYEPILRREIRLGIRDPQLGRVMDSTDVCQSIWSSFFVRIAAGQFDLQNPKQLTSLLATMAKHKLISQARWHHAAKRNLNRLARTDEALGYVQDRQPTPSGVVSLSELADLLREQLSEEELRIAELRRQGSTWLEIAAHLGGTPQARRMQMIRVANRLAKQFGWEEEL